MAEVAVTGTPEQLLLITLAKKVDDMDERLSSCIAQLGARLPAPGPSPCPLSEFRPPCDETAQEEAERLVADLGDKKRNELLSNTSRRRVTRVAHKVNRDHLRRNGFDVQYNCWSQCVIKWAPVEPAVNRTEPWGD